MLKEGGSMQTNILEYLEHTVLDSADKCAFSGENGSLTFGELYAQSRSVGSFLAKEGYYKNPIVVFMKKQPKTLAAFLGVIYSGCFYVPLDDEMPKHRIELILSNLNPSACICDESTVSQAQEFSNTGKIICYDDISSGEIDEAALNSVRSRQLDTDPIYIVFTSGSTGIPKGVVGCHRAVIDYVENLCEVLKFNKDSVFGNQTPLYFDAYLKEVIPTLKYGATTHLIPRKLFMLPVKLVEYLNEKKINTLCWVVSALTFVSSLKTFDKIKPEYLHTIAFASEVFPIRQLNIWRSVLPNARFINLYGPTETTGICCYYEVEKEFAEGDVLPIGKPFKNTEIILLDENDKVPPAGEQGEICIRGTRLTLGYFRNPEKTSEAFVQNPLNDQYPELIYRTGDLGKFNEQGELLFLSRKDNQIKHMGHRIELGEIEVVANAHDEISTACCVFDSDRKKIVLFYVGNITEIQLMQYLKEKLPRYMIPHTIKQLETMPLTPNGKIDRNLLKQRSKENG